MKIVLGARGRLGSALMAEFNGQRVLAPDRRVYEDWWEADAVPKIRNYLLGQAEGVEMILIAAGVIDPAASPLEHDRVNRLLPQQVILAAASLNIRVITFGTMMEAIALDMGRTGYVASKAALARFVEEQSRTHGYSLHLRVHTLYGGGPPDPFMFTGQMLTALREGTPFLMSPGAQLREYHHVEDEARAIAILARSRTHGVAQIDHGDPISLAELAQTTFRALGRVDLLRIGALPQPSHENPDLRFERMPALRDHSFRDVRIAMPSYLADHLPS